MNLRISLICVLISIVVTTSVAQDSPETPFPVEERCVEDVVQPSDSWTYEGTLLMSGYAGIHAVQADWNTLRVVAFFYADDRGEPIDGGQISPNGRWYVAPIGEIFTEVSYNQYWFTRGLRIYSTFDDNELDFDLYEYNDLLDYGRGYGAWTYEVVRWIDDESFIFGPFLFRPFENIVQKSNYPNANAGVWDFEVAPDWTRIYGFTNLGSSLGFFDPEFPDSIINHLETQAVAWRHDSLSLIVEQRVETVEQLSLFDRDGEFVQTLFISEGGRIDIRRPIAGRNELGWSNDNRYFAFEHFPPQAQPTELIILDIENQIAINTCLTPVSQPVWSPHANQVAFLMQARENLRVVILDLDTWTAYDVARHSGVSGAFLPDMISWSDNG